MEKKGGNDDLKDSKENTQDHNDDTGNNGETKPVDDVVPIEDDNDGNDTLNMNILEVLFQVKYKMIRSHYYLIYDNDVDTTSIATMQLVVVLYQVKCEMISPFHLIYNNNDDDNTNFSTSINGEKYTYQSKYKDEYGTNKCIRSNHNRYFVSFI